MRADRRRRRRARPRGRDRTRRARLRGHAVRAQPRPRRQRLVAGRRHARALLRGRERAGERGRARRARASNGGRGTCPTSRATARWSSRRRATRRISTASPRARAAGAWLDEAGHRRAGARSRRALPQGPVLRRGGPSRSARGDGRAVPAARSPRAPSLRFGQPFPGGERADVIVDCRGWAAREALPELRGVRGEMLLVRTHEVRLSRPVRLLHPRIPLYVVPRADGLFMIGATMIESAEKGGVTRALGDRTAERRLRAASGLRRGRDRRDERRRAPGLPRQRAAPDRAPTGRLYLNGAYRHGWLLAPDLAAEAAEAGVEQTAQDLPNEPGQRYMKRNGRLRMATTIADRVRKRRDALRRRGLRPVAALGAGYAQARRSRRNADARRG